VSQGYRGGVANSYLLCGGAGHEIHSVPVVLTMMDGRITHDAR
jgi:hypothetical protein